MTSKLKLLPDPGEPDRRQVPGGGSPRKAVVRRRHGAEGMLGAFGAMAMAGEGNDIVARNGIDDPSIYIGEEIAKALAARYKVAIERDTSVSDTDDLEQLARRYRSNDLILFTQTRGWSFTYFPANWDNHRVGLNMIVKLYDPKRKSVLAAGCAYEPEYADSDEAPTHDELLATTPRA